MAKYWGIGNSSINLLTLGVISFGMAYFSYKIIESEMFRSSWKIAIAVCLSVVVTSILSIDNINAAIFKTSSIQIADYKNLHSKEIDKQFSIGCCFITSKQSGPSVLNKKRCLSIDKTRKNILLIGDSHAADLSQSLRSYFAKYNINMNQANASGCSPLIKSKGVNNSCIAIMDFVYRDYIVNHAAEIDGVIISDNWIDIIDGDAESMIQNIRNTISFLQKHHINTILIGQNEMYTLPYATIAAREFQYDIKIKSNYSDHDSFAVNDYLEEYLHEWYIPIINKDSVPPLSSAMIPYMFDKNHFTKYGADLTVAKITQNPLMIKFLQSIIKKTNK
jgi:hypothetical protein